MIDDFSYTPEEVASILKVSRSTVYELLKTGELAGYRIGKSLRILRIQSSDLSEYIEKAKYIEKARYNKKTKEKENILDGEIQIKNGNKYIKIGNIFLNVVTKYEGHVKVTIEPEDIILVKEKLMSSAQNVLHCKVIEIIEQDSFVKIKLDATFPLVAFITNQSLKELELTCGQSIYAIFKATSIKVFE